MPTRHERARRVTHVACDCEHRQHEEKIITDAAAKYTGMSTQVVHRAYKTKKLRGYAAGPYGPVYYTRSDLDAWLDSMASIPEPEQQPEAEETPAPARPSRRRTKAKAGAR